MNYDQINERECVNNTTTASTTTPTTSTTTPTTTPTTPTTTCAPVDHPTFDPASGSEVTFPVSVNIYGPAGAAIFYTLDGSTPTIHSTGYSGPVSVAHGQTLKAIAVTLDGCVSIVAAAFYLNTTTTTPSTTTTSHTTTPSTTTTPVTTGECPVDFNLVVPSITSLFPVYFETGANFPAGGYRITYVEGALRYGPEHLWNLNFNFGINTCFRIIYNDGATVTNGPGNDTEYPNQAAVESANAGAHKDIHHLGGKIGLYLSDNFYSDNIAGSPNPTFLLTRLCDIPTTTPTTTPHTTMTPSTTSGPPPTTTALASSSTTPAPTTTPHTTAPPTPPPTTTTNAPTTPHGPTTTAPPT